MHNGVSVLEDININKKLSREVSVVRECRYIPGTTWGEAVGLTLKSSIFDKNKIHVREDLKHATVLNTVLYKRSLC